MTSTNDSITERIHASDPEAALTQVDGRWVLTMRRRLPHPVERVWPMLVDPTQLARWSPVVPDRPLDAPGAATAQESPAAAVVDAEVLVVEAPRVLVHHWAGHVLRWTLEPVDGGSDLTLEHTVDEHDRWASFAAGWHICLAVLGAVLAGDDVDRVVGPRAEAYGWAHLKVRYASAATPSH